MEKWFIPGLFLAISSGLLLGNYESRRNKQVICEGYLNNVRQALITINEMDVNPISEPKTNDQRNRLFLVRSELSNFCSNQDKLDSIIKKVDCDSFKDAYNKVAINDIPSYIICDSRVIEK